jgi:TetR/AcrR family transcriptional regulator
MVIIKLFRKEGPVIYEKFHALAVEKQERIINAAMKEFTASGYKKASTNSIISEADISKGSLFKYFHHKKGMYFFLLDYAVSVVETIYSEIDYSETDLFDRLSRIGRIKFRIQQAHPQVFEFLLSAHEEKAEEIRKEKEHKMAVVRERGFSFVYEGIDFSKFREDIDTGKAVEILNWSMTGFAEQEIRQMGDEKKITEEQFTKWEEYAALLRKCFYKEPPGE